MVLWLLLQPVPANRQAESKRAGAVALLCGFFIVSIYCTRYKNKEISEIINLNNSYACSAFFYTL